MDATHSVSSYQGSLSLLPSTQNFLSTTALSRHPQQSHQQQAAAKQTRCLIMEFHKERIQRFWQQQMFDMLNTIDAKQHSLPLTRIKKIMKADPEVKMISAETPYLFSRACEMLVLDLTLRSWLHTEDCNRRTLQKGDILTAVDHSADMDFLLDVLPKEPTEEELACHFYTKNDASMYPLSMINLPFLHEATSYGPNSYRQAIQSHVCEPENISPFMVARPDIASDLLTYDFPKENGGLEEIVMTLMEAPPSIACPPVNMSREALS